MRVRGHRTRSVGPDFVAFFKVFENNFTLMLHRIDIESVFRPVVIRRLVLLSVPCIITQHMGFIVFVRIVRDGRGRVRLVVGVGSGRWR